MSALTVKILILCAGGALAIAWALYITGNGGDFDRTLRNRLSRAWRRIVFWAGDVRRLSHFPWVTWDVSEHLVEYDEASSALPLIRPGDIGLHREKGYLSNLAIPGFMKHAWIHLDGPVCFRDPDGGERTDTTGMQIVEAVSEGVLRRSALFPIRSDYTVILRPRGVTPEEVHWALDKARRIIGCRYDADFEFDIEDELKLFAVQGEPPDRQAARRQELENIRANLRAEWDGGFSCSETVSFAWWHERERLKLRREKIRGKNVILPDRFLNEGLEIVWMSDSVTPEAAEKFGLPEEGREMIRRYRAAHPPGSRPAPVRRGRFWRRLRRRFSLGGRPTSQSGSPGSPPPGRTPGSS